MKEFKTISIQVADQQLKKVLDSGHSIEGAIASKYQDVYEVFFKDEYYSRRIEVKFREDDLEKFQKVARQSNVSLEEYLSYLFSIY